MHRPPRHLHYNAVHAIFELVFEVPSVRHLLTIVLLSMLLASCGKDEQLQPRCHIDAAAGAFDKDGEDPDQPDAGGDTDTISDDGDDLNDGEGRKKKKKP